MPECVTLIAQDGITISKLQIGLYAGRHSISGFVSNLRLFVPSAKLLREVEKVPFLTSSALASHHKQ
jgi:hypothetical protein